jgi:hypothetical protein
MLKILAMMGLQITDYKERLIDRAILSKDINIVRYILSLTTLEVDPSDYPSIFQYGPLSLKKLLKL